MSDGGVLRGHGILRDEGPRDNQARQNHTMYMSGVNNPRTPTVQERIRWAVERGRAETDRYHQALRAAELLERHPEAAELFELLRQF